MGRIKAGDYAAIILSISIALISGLLIYTGYPPPELLEISSDSGKSVYPLDQERVLEIEGPIGISVIVISGKSAWFRDSPCPDKLCVKTGHLHDSGHWAGCLPNRIFIRIKGKEKEDEKIDSLSF